MMLLSTSNSIVSLVVKRLKPEQTVKFVQDDTKSKKTRKTWRVLLKNIFFMMSHNRWKMLFIMNIGRKHLDSMESQSVKLIFGTGKPDHQCQCVMLLPATLNTSFSM